MSRVANPLSMTQNDLFSIEDRLRISARLLKISLRIPWAGGVQAAITHHQHREVAPAHWLKLLEQLEPVWFPGSLLLKLLPLSRPREEHSPDTPR